MEIYKNTVVVYTYAIAFIFHFTATKRPGLRCIKNKPQTKSTQTYQGCPHTFGHTLQLAHKDFTNKMKDQLIYNDALSQKKKADQNS